MDVIEFLRARLTEDRDAVAEWPARVPEEPPPSGGVWIDHSGHPIYGVRDHVLADLDGKTRILDLLTGVEFTGDGRPIRLDGGYTDAWWDVVRLLAERYVAHPDYRPEWRWTP